MFDNTSATAANVCITFTARSHSKGHAKSAHGEQRSTQGVVDDGNRHVNSDAAPRGRVAVGSRTREASGNAVYGSRGRVVSGSRPRQADGGSVIWWGGIIWWRAVCWWGAT